MRADLLRHLAANADRNADDDEIGAFDRLGIGLGHLVGDAELDDALPRLGRPRGGDDPPHRALRAGGAHDGRADQAGADDGERVEQRLRHWRDEPLPLMKAVSASSTAQLSSSVPIVMRSASGKPYSVT